MEDQLAGGRRGVDLLLEAEQGDAAALQLFDDDETRDLSDAELMRSIRRLVVDLDILEPASAPFLIEGQGSDPGEGEAR